MGIAIQRTVNQGLFSIYNSGPILKILNQSLIILEIFNQGLSIDLTY